MPLVKFQWVSLALVLELVWMRCAAGAVPAGQVAEEILRRLNEFTKSPTTVSISTHIYEVRNSKVDNYQRQLPVVDYYVGEVLCGKC